VTAKYIIKDTFKITGRELVLTGHIEEGVIYLGDYIEFTAFDKGRKRRITGIEGITKATADKTNTGGLLIKCEDENEIDELRTWRPNADVGVISKT
jgi:translation elongation factor EF-Tu-like GTPase